MTVNAFNNGVLDSLTTHIAVLNAQGVIVAVNKAWRQFGAENGLPEPSHSQLGANYLDTCKNAVNQPDGDEANAAQAGIAAVLAGEQEHFYLEYPCHSPNQQRWFSMNVSPLQGSVGGVVVSHENITKRKLAEIALRDSESRFSAVIEATPIPKALNDAHGNITYLNQAFIEIIGYNLNDIPTLAVWWSCAYPDLHYQQWVIENWQNHLAEAICSKQPFVPIELNITCKDGTVRTFMVAASALKDNFADTYLVTLYDITERKQIEEKLLENQALLKSIIDCTPSNIFAFDLQHRFTLLNDAMANFYGLPEEEVLGKTLHDVFPNELANRLMAINSQILTTGEPLTCEEVVMSKFNNIPRYVITSKFPLRDANGNINGLGGVATDITERKLAEEALKASESRWKFAIEGSGGGLWDWNIVNNTVFYSKFWKEMIGYSEDEIGNGLDEFEQRLHPEDKSATLTAVQNCLDGKASIYLSEYRFFCKDGSYIWMIDRGIVVDRDEAGKPLRMIGTHIDITERKLAEETIQASKAKLEAALASMNDAVFISDTEGRFMEFNEAFATFHKFKNKEDCPKTLAEYPNFIDVYSSSGEFLPLEQRGVPRALRGETGAGVEFTLKRKDTGETWIGSYSYAPIRNIDGVIVGSVVSARDITERKKAEALLRESEEKLRLFIHYSPSAIAMFDCNMRYLAYSQRWLVDYGLGEPELIGRCHYDVFPDIPERWKELHQRSLAGAIEKCDRDCFPRANGSLEWIHWEMHPWLTSAGDIGGIILFSEVITERVKIEQALLTREKEFRLLAESMPQIVWITNPEGENIYFNQQWQDYTGLSPEESYGHNWVKPYHPDDQQQAWDAWQNAIKNNGTYAIECRLRRTDGVYRWWLIRGIPVFDETGKTYKWFGTCTDIHELKESEKSLRIAAIAFESQEAMVITDAKQTILKVNQAFTRMTGYSAEEAIGNTPALLKSGNQDKQFYDTLWEALNRDKFWTGEIWNRRKNGELYPEWLNISAVTDANGQVSNYVAAFSDITASKKLEETIHHLAFYDRLTKLPNRRLLIEHLQQALNASTRHFNHGAILFIDLDNFKELNDIRGYEVGDSLLIEVAQRLQHCVRSNDMVACLGGDDFVIILEELSRETEQAAVQAESFAEKIHVTLSRPFDLQGQQYYNACSIGISLFCNHDISVDDLLKYADTAMYQAKKSGRNSIRFFDPVTHAAMKERIALEFDLRLALPNQQFQLHYQMQVDNMGKILGAEALIRWQHPERGLVPPMQFIHLLEESGLIVGIGLWILETACAQIKRWELNDHTQHLQLAVNVSARQFRQADFVEQLCAVLAKTAINPNRLKLELTESLILEDVSGTIIKIQALKEIGVHFSMDDFGTGYSSLSYLSKLPMDQLKIDQSFVCNIGVKDSDAVIVQTIIGMAKNLDMEVIAEGVETEQQRDFLERNGCTHYQGYLFSKPLPLEEFEQLLRNKSDL